MTTIPGDLGDLFASYARHLRAIGRSPKTIDSYRDAVARLAAFVPNGALDNLTVDVVRDWLVHEQQATSPGSVGIRYRSARAFCNWLEAEGEVDLSPMKGIPHPAQPDKPTPVLSVDDVRRLLAATKPADSKDWRSIRDRALVMFMIDTGARRGEVASITIPDVDLDLGEVRITGKTGTRVVSLGTAAVASMDRWLRARRRAAVAARTDALWVGDRGSISDEGIRQILKRLGERAGVKVAPHQLRHTTSHVLRASGMGDAELMELMGWKSAAMLAKYGRSAVGERARAMHKQIAPGDLI